MHADATAGRPGAMLTETWRQAEWRAPVQLSEQGPQAPALHTCSAHAAVLQAASTGAGGSAEQPGSPCMGASACPGPRPDADAAHSAVRAAVPPSQGALQSCQALKRHCVPVHGNALRTRGPPSCLLDGPNRPIADIPDAAWAVNKDEQPHDTKRRRQEEGTKSSRGALAGLRGRHAGQPRARALPRLAQQPRRERAQHRPLLPPAAAAAVAVAPGPHPGARVPERRRRGARLRDLCITQFYQDMACPSLREAAVVRVDVRCRLGRAPYSRGMGWWMQAEACWLGNAARSSGHTCGPDGGYG